MLFGPLQVGLHNDSFITYIKCVKATNAVRTPPDIDKAAAQELVAVSTQQDRALAPGT